jgi:hypothetical protein
MGILSPSWLEPIYQRPSYRAHVKVSPRRWLRVEWSACSYGGDPVARQASLAPWMRTDPAWRALMHPSLVFAFSAAH